MITTAAMAIAEKSAPSQGGSSGNAANGQASQAQDFLNAVNRITFSSAPAAAFARETPFPDTTRPVLDDPRTPEYRDAPVQSSYEERNTPVENELPATTPTETPAASDETPPPSDQAISEVSSPDSPATPASPAAVPETQTPATPPTNGATPTASADRAAPPPPPTTPVNPPAPEQAAPSQQTRPQAGQANGVPGAQIVDDGVANQLPQTNQTLSGRAALVAQSQPAKGTTDGAPKAATGESGASSLFASTAQAAGNNGNKSKGATRAGANAQAAGAKNAASAQGGQGASQQAAAQPAVPIQTQQQTLSNAALGNKGSAGQTWQQPTSARAETFTPAGTSQSAPQFNLRNAASTSAPRPATPVPTRVVTNQVAVQIQKAAGQGHDRISIQLKPADLGRVEVRLDVGADGRVAAVISADRADTLDMLQRDARILQNSLQNAGLQADSNSLSFELKGQNQAFGETENGTPNGEEFVESETETDADIAAAALAQAGIVSNDRVDIQI